MKVVMSLSQGYAGYGGLTAANLPMMDAFDISECLTPKQLAQRLALNQTTLLEWRRRKYGPKFFRLNRRVYYPIEKFNQWIENQLAD